jgi:hypothetical protein
MKRQSCMLTKNSHMWLFSSMSCSEYGLERLSNDDMMTRHHLLKMKPHRCHRQSIREPALVKETLEATQLRIVRKASLYLS